MGVDTLSIELGRLQGCYVHRTLTAHNKVPVLIFIKKLMKSNYYSVWSGMPGKP